MLHLLEDDEDEIKNNLLYSSNREQVTYLDDKTIEKNNGELFEV